MMTVSGRKYYLVAAALRGINVESQWAAVSPVCVARIACDYFCLLSSPSDPSVVTANITRSIFEHVTL